MSAVLIGHPGRVVVLDEPAVNLHPTLQRRLLRHLLDGQGWQVIVVTHSPYLVPARSADDLRRLVRLTWDQVGTRVHRLQEQTGADGNGTAPNAVHARWRQILASSADARGALFTRGVVLVEGDTEVGLFEQWLPATTIALADRSLAPDALNLMVLPVGGDQCFGAYTSFLEAFGIPWVIVCDGPVLSPQYRGGTPLVRQFQQAGVAAPDAVAPADPADFHAWKAYWAKRGVFTLATQFGGHNDRDKSGEIEAFLDGVDASRWEAANAAPPKSKVRAAHHFAEQVPCPPLVDELYQCILRTLRLV